jgi:DNA-binding MarR family transcriptional regulator
MTKTNLDKVDIRSSVHLLHRAGQCADDLFSSTINDMQLTPRQYTVLHCAAVAQGASQTDLVESTGIDRSTLADIVRRLVERGLLARERTQQDARMYSVQVTDTGHEVLEKARPVMDASENRLLDAVGPADREAFVRALRKIIDTFGPISSARVSGRHQRPEPEAATASRQSETAGL